MKRLLIDALFTAVVSLGASSALADEKVDVSAVTTKADAGKILGVPVKDARGQNKESKVGFYDSEWNYYATKGDKALVFDFLVGPPGLAATMLSALPTDGGKFTKLEGFGDKAIFYHDKTGLEMMNILKSNTRITIGIHGMPRPAASSLLLAAVYDRPHLPQYGIKRFISWTRKAEARLKKAADHADD